jgi:Holliday junction resolvase
VSSGKSSQRKGAQGERELAKLLEEEGYPMERGGACFGTVPDLVGLPGIHVEVKRVEKLNVSEAMRQAERDADRFLDGAPAVFHRRNREPWLVTMRFSDWLPLYKAGCEAAEGPRSAASSGRINEQAEG